MPLPHRYPKTAALATIAFAWACLFGYVFVHSLPYNPIGSLYPDRVGIRAFIPEGWAFFTKNPREEQFMAYTVQAGEWQPALSMPVARPRNVFGLNRAARAQGVELGLLLKQIPESAWSPCSEPNAACLRVASLEAPVVNAAAAQTLCGEIGVVFREPVPWAWRRKVSSDEMPASVAKIQVQCS